MKRTAPLKRTAWGWPKGKSARRIAPRLDIERAAALYAEGQGLPQIAETLNCDTGNLSRALRCYGVTMRKPSDYATPIDVAEVVARYEALEGYSKIAREMHISATRVKKTLIQQGIHLRPVGRVKGLKTGRRGVPSYDTEFQDAMVLVRERSGGRCESGMAPGCTGRGTHGHHRKLRKQGGQNDLATLLHVCMPCHMVIHHRPADSYELGHLVHSWDEPADVPVLDPAGRVFHCHENHALTEDNTYTDPEGNQRCRTCRRNEKLARTSR